MTSVKGYYVNDIVRIQSYMQVWMRHSRGRIIHRQPKIADPTRIMVAPS
jgi:hypothetical protein